MILFDSKLLNSKNIAVGVSMGVDSVASAYFLSNCFNITMIHVNHGTFMANQYQDSFVKFADYLKSVSRNKVNSVICENGETKDFSESYLRDIRYGFFDDTMNAVELKHLVVCHHLDDCVESYLMNCLKGQPEHYPIPKETIRRNYSVVRPFLKTDKDEFISYCVRHEIDKFVVNDVTNMDSKYTRNWVRNELIPMVKMKYSGIKTVVKKRL